MQFGIVSLFPGMFDALHAGIIGKALKTQTIHIAIENPRDYAENNYRRIDDTPYGGGPGLIMQAPPIKKALQELKKTISFPVKTIYVSPQGKLFNQQAAIKLAQSPALIFICGRYEGIDERIIIQDVDEEWSVGDYILTGGELAAMMMIDAITRVLPEVVGDPESVQTDSLSNGLLKYPQYTRPEQVEGLKVPDILLSGNHVNIEKWRKQQALLRTREKRPDLFAKYSLSEDDITLLSKLDAKTP